jgi:mono/diheme cytochrome c family protein
MRITFLLGITLWMAAAWTAAGQQQRPGGMPPLVIESMTGRELFTFYCASCHGRSAKGDGPTAAALKIAPPDLTLLARRAGGTYPRSSVEAFVTGTGRPVPAHGSGEMPVWGPIFRSLDPSEPRTKVRITNIVDYLESIQVK